jgi:hypothetical protein
MERLQQTRYLKRTQKKLHTMSLKLRNRSRNRAGQLTVS